jgi:hypothetical protein
VTKETSEYDPVQADHPGRRSSQVGATEENQNGLD